MGSLDVWGAIAASILLLQCIVFNLIFVVLALGLWKGAEWVHLHTDMGLTKLHEWLMLGRRYAMKGQSYVASPFVRLGARVLGWRTAWNRLKG